MRISQLLALLCSLLLVQPLVGATRTSTQSGNWNATSTWGGNPVPVVGDRAYINNHTVTVTASAVVGLSVPLDATFGGGATCRLDNGTPGIAGVVLTGVGTSFLSQIEKGDAVSLNGGTSWSIINTVTSDTVAAVFISGNVAATTNCTYRKASIFIEGTSGQLAISANQSLEVRGDVNMKNGTLTGNAGTVLTLDNSASTGSPRIHPTAGGDVSYTSTINFNTACGARATIQGVTALPAHIRENSAATAFDVRCTEIKLMGDTAETLSGIRVTPNTTRTFRMDDVTLDRVGRIYVVGAAVGASVIFNNVKVTAPLAVASSRYTQIQLSQVAGTVTGTRTFTNNVISHPLADLTTVWETNVQGVTATTNVFGRVRGPSSTNFANWRNNVQIRGPQCAGAGLPFWSFTGTGGDTIADTYVHNWVGIRQDQECNFMPNDSITTGAGAVVLFSNHTVDIVGPTNVALHNLHIGAHTNATTLRSTGLLVLPMSNGLSQNAVIARGQAGSTYEIDNSTVLTNAYHTSSNTSGHYFGAIYAGHAGMLNTYRYNFGWAPTPYAPISSETGGFQQSYNAGVGSPVTDVIVNAGFGPSAHFNASTGNWYTPAGALGAAVLGFDRFRMTTNPTTSNDVNLGSGTGDPRLIGPGFADPRRNMMSYDSLGLGNTAPPWQTGSVYAVGDVVSASDAGFYNGLTFNFECTVAHTAAIGDPTTGNPTVAANWGDRWMPRSHRRLYDNTSLIPSFIAWVRAGWSPQNQRLAVPSASTYMGAVPVRLMIAAISQ